MPAKRLGLSGTQLKLLAVVTMTVDHVGAFLLPGVMWLRYVGRLAFPIFAYLIVEGCRYTSSRPRYLANMCAFGGLSQLVTWLAQHTWRQSIFTTLALSVATIWALQWWEEGRADGRSWFNARMVAPLAMVALDVAICVLLVGALPRELGFQVQYRLPGVLLPVLAYLPWLGYPRRVKPPLWTARRVASLALFALGLAWVNLALGVEYQWLSMLALVPIALYNGERGARIPKHLFYLYYPLHLAIIYALAGSFA